MSGSRSASPERAYTIGHVAERTGLSSSVIRMWESRYAAVSPDRSASGQRRFSEGDVRRLLLLKSLVDAGHRISLIAGLSDDELLESAALQGRPLVPLMGDAATLHPTDAIDALRRLDRERFRSTLDHAVVRLGRVDMMERFLAPMMREIGERCASGDLRMTHEHLATAEVRGFLGNVAGAYPAAPRSPCLVVGTPAWQHHELGALLVAASAQAEGWRVLYLGPNLPAAELASAATQVEAEALALSITYMEDPGQLRAELADLRRLLPDDTELLVGGQGADAAPELVAEAGAVHCSSLAEFRERLARIRTRRSSR